MDFLFGRSGEAGLRKYQLLITMGSVRLESKKYQESIRASEGMSFLSKEDVREETFPELT